MTRYENTFAALDRKKQKAFIPFAVAGDPDPHTSERILRTYIENGADILEIGYPFSDPIADGPVNQRAAQRALAAGMNLSRFLKCIRNIRRVSSDIPIGLLLYANTVYHYGYHEFCDMLAKAGVDSLLVADMPPEESEELLAAMRKTGLLSVFIVSEYTPIERITYLSTKTTGFLYVVSRPGVTGVQKELSTSVKNTLKKIRPCTSRPLCVGFGLSRPEHVAAVCRSGAHGAIVGSRLVSLIETHLGDRELMMRSLAREVRRLKKATRLGEAEGSVPSRSFAKAGGQKSEVRGQLGKPPTATL